MCLVDACVDDADLDTGAGIGRATGGLSIGRYRPSYCACFTIGAEAIVPSFVPFSCTATAFSEMSNSPVTFTAGAFAFSSSTPLGVRIGKIVGVSAASFRTPDGGLTAPA